MNGHFIESTGFLFLEMCCMVVGNFGILVIIAQDEIKKDPFACENPLISRPAGIMYVIIAAASCIFLIVLRCLD